MNHQNCLAGVFGHTRRHVSPAACKQLANPADADAEADNTPPTDVVPQAMAYIFRPTENSRLIWLYYKYHIRCKVGNNLSVYVMVIMWNYIHE